MSVYLWVLPSPVRIKGITNPLGHREWRPGKEIEHFYSGLWATASNRFQFAWATAYFSGLVAHDTFTAPFLSQTVADITS